MEHDHLVWEASLYERYEHSADWYWVVGIITTALAIAFFIAGNILLSLVIIIGVATLLYHSKQEPVSIRYEISRKGIRAGKTLYRWDSLKSFWIVEQDETSRHPSPAKILLTSQKSFTPHIVIPFKDIDIEEMHQILSNMLPEEFQIEPLPDRIMRKLGF